MRKSVKPVGTGPGIIYVNWTNYIGFTDFYI